MAALTASKRPATGTQVGSRSSFHASPERRPFHPHPSLAPPPTSQHQLPLYLASQILYRLSVDIVNKKKSTLRYRARQHSELYLIPAPASQLARHSPPVAPLSVFQRIVVRLEDLGRKENQSLQSSPISHLQSCIQSASRPRRRHQSFSYRPWSFRRLVLHL